jgi:hypothetical protein
MTHFKSGSVAKLESRTFRGKTENAKERKRRCFTQKAGYFE